jgi:hypothetical protein
MILYYILPFNDPFQGGINGLICSPRKPANIGRKLLYNDEKRGRTFKSVEPSNGLPPAIRVRAFVLRCQCMRMIDTSAFELLLAGIPQKKKATGVMP